MTERASPRRPLIELGRAVRAGRERRRLTIAEIAEQGGCVENTWTKVERGGAVRKDSYQKIAAGLRVPAELVIAAAMSVKALPALLEAIAGVGDDPTDGPILVAPNRLTDGQLLYVLGTVVDELKHRHRDQEANLRGLKAAVLAEDTARRYPQIRGTAQRLTTGLDGAAHRTGEENQDGMG